MWDVFIFLGIHYFHHLGLICLCNDFYGLSALVGCWSLVFIRRSIYNFFFNVCTFDYTVVVNFNGKVGIRKLINHTHRVAIVTPTDRPISNKFVCKRTLFSKLIHNLFVIEDFGGVFV